MSDDDEVTGRAARMKAAFPGAYHEDGALVSFDMGAIKAAIGWHDPVETRSGLEFTRLRDEVWVSLSTQVGNVVSAWSWRISADEWARIVAAIPPDPHNAPVAPQDGPYGFVSTETGTDATPRLSAAPDGAETATDDFR